MKLLYRLYQLLVAPLLLCLTIATALVTIVGCTLFSAAWWSYWPGRLWSVAFVRLLLLPVSVSGREHMQRGQSYVVVANHQGAFDIFLVYGFLGRHFKWVLKRQLRELPLVGKACESAGFIFIDQKGGPKALRESYTKAERTVRDGVSVVVFPEGSRTYDGTMQPFKRGAFQMAHALQLPILPVTIDGPFDVLPRSRGLGFVSWHPLYMQIHPPFIPSGTGSEAERASAAQAYHIIHSGLPQSKHEVES